MTWGGLYIGAALGLWRPTGARTAEMLMIWRDTDLAVEVDGPGTATFRFTAEVDDTDTTLTRSSGTIDVRDQYGTPRCPAGPWTVLPSTRVTFDVNPATGSTVTEATPAAGTPTA